MFEGVMGSLPDADRDLAAIASATKVAPPKTNLVFLVFLLMGPLLRLFHLA
jgi:hypothetical protein